MTWAILIISLLLQVVAHEAGHAAAIRSYGMKVVGAGIGFGRPRLERKWRGVTWTLSPWIFGAYVEQDREEAKQTRSGPYRRLTWVMNAGVMVNLAIGLLCGSALMVMSGRWLPAIAMVIALVPLAICPRDVAAYGVPLVGPASLWRGCWRSIICSASACSP